ncbi:hypothetical protein HG536_0D04020 [Torulaspora globosa]|uniref:Uncharacterized protein n=1 Tax=Torulaspora globosa TaxID=48254 RepID=A0A7G3ZH94_9SACH|nr:uncharacterized protein HG536_0D04020 [Torulaspora globosa]QLL32880.1 hypothetical protein HG536_0D04020 [Torulaspora globosa]
MSDFFKQAKDKLTGDTNVANEHLKKLSSKYQPTAEEQLQTRERNEQAYSTLIGAGQKHKDASNERGSNQVRLQ